MSAKKNQPATLVIFGASGDLASRKLLPALYNLAVTDDLPEHFRLVGVAFDIEPEQFNDHIYSALESFSRTGVDEKVWQRFQQTTSFVKGSFNDPELYQGLSAALAEIEDGGEAERLFYLAVAPRFFGMIAENLGKAKLGKHAKRPSWLFVEKPFGHDLKSAKELNHELRRGFDDRQIMRIDHYLAKETVQNLLFFRFTNGIFEPVWNRRYVDSVQITVAEELGIGERADYYDQSGALRDVVQNHMMQLLALVAMEPPVCFEAVDIHAEKVKALNAVKRLSEKAVGKEVVRGQYTAGNIAGKDVVAYCDEDGVPDDSRTETYVALRLAVDNWRWAGTPFYLRTGKRMPRRLTEIAVMFKPVPHMPLARTVTDAVEPNQLVFQIQPDEGVTLRLMEKVPGLDLEVRPVEMDFEYSQAFTWESPEAYERLLHDALIGNHTRFTSTAEVEATWEIIDPVIKAWGDGSGEIFRYPAGGNGPSRANHLMEQDGRSWRSLGTTE